MSMSNNTVEIIGCHIVDVKLNDITGIVTVLFIENCKCLHCCSGKKILAVVNLLDLLLNVQYNYVDSYTHGRKVSVLKMTIGKLFQQSELPELEINRMDFQ